MIKYNFSFFILLVFPFIFQISSDWYRSRHSKYSSSHLFLNSDQTYDYKYRSGSCTAWFDSDGIWKIVNDTLSLYDTIEIEEEVVTYELLQSKERSCFQVDFKHLYGYNIDTLRFGVALEPYDILYKPPMKTVTDIIEYQYQYQLDTHNLEGGLLLMEISNRNGFYHFDSVFFDENDDYIITTINTSPNSEIAVIENKYLVKKRKLLFLSETKYTVKQVCLNFKSLYN